jgi:hypothetical protein
MHIPQVRFPLVLLKCSSLHVCVLHRSSYSRSVCVA